ncbi:MAG: pilus assembly protein PilM [Pseudomonadota bacterium]|nr:pilus assembly protein PilM [Pseudomonadota bacterium]
MAFADAFRSVRLPALASRFSLDELVERWLDALLTCLPDGLRRRLTPPDQRLIIALQGSAAELLRPQEGELRSIGELDLHAAGSLQALLAGARREQRRMVIRLPADQVLTRTISFPVQVRDNLQQVMRYEIDRLSPFQADQVFFNFRIQDLSAHGDKLVVELAICRRDRVEKWLKLLREADAPAEQVTWEGAWSKANLLPPEERPHRRRSIFSLNRLLALLILLLTAAALLTPLWQKREIRTLLMTEVDDLKAKAEEVQEVRDALERAREGSVAVLQRKWEQPRVIELLRELTERLPDDTWVQNLDVNGPDIQVRGQSKQATALINLLEKAPGISSVTFRSPVVQVRGLDQERFHISFTYARAQPQ